MCIHITCATKKRHIVCTTTQAGTLNRFVAVKLSDETGENCSATQLTKAFLNTAESVFKVCHYIAVKLAKRKVY